MSHPTVSSRYSRPTGRRIGIATLVMSLLVGLLTVAATATPAAAQVDPVTCWTIADAQVNDGNNAETVADTLVRIDDALGAPSATVVGGIGGLSTTDAEALALRRSAPDGEIAIWAWDTSDGLVVIDPTDQSQAAAPITIAPPKVEGLTWANTEDADESNDLLYAIDENGVITSYTIAGATTVIGDVADGAGGFVEGADIAWDPESDILYATTTQASDVTQLVQVNIGQAPLFTVLGGTQLDLEGLGYAFGNGTSQQVGTTGNDDSNSFYTVADNGAVANQFDLAAATSVFDFEDVDCEWPSEFEDGVISAVLEPVTCPGGDGEISVTVSYDSGNQPVDYSVTIDGVTTTGTINLGDADVVITESGLADGTYAVVATNTTADPDEELLNDAAVVVACDGVATGSAAAVCRNDDRGGVVEFTLDNGTNAAVVYTLQVETLGDLNVSVPANTMTTQLRTNADADGTYTVTLLADGVQVFTGDVVIDCSPDPIVTAGPVVCNGNPSVPTSFVTLDNTLVETDTDFVLMYEGATFMLTVAQGATITLPLGPVPAGMSTVTVDTVPGLMLFDMDFDNALVCEAAASAVPECRSDDLGGFFEFTLTNNTGLPVDFTLQVETLADSVVTVPANDEVVTLRTNANADGVYTITILADGAEVFTGDLLLDCSPDPTATITQVTCVGNEPAVELTLDNTGVETTTDFIVTVTDSAGSMFPVFTPMLAPDGVLGPLPLGPLVVGTTTIEVTTVPGLVLQNQTIVVTEPCYEVDAAGFCNALSPTDGKIRVTYTNNSQNAITFEAEVTGGPTTVVNRFDTIAPGVTNNLTFNEILLDGTYTVTIKVFGVMPDYTEQVTLTCQMPPVDGTPSADSAVACPGGDLTVTYDVTGGNQPFDFVTTINGAAQPTVTVAADATDTTTVALADGTYAVIVTADGVQVYSETVTVNCTAPGTPGASLGDIVCASGGTVDLTLEVDGGSVPLTFVVAIDGQPMPNQVVAGSTSTVTTLGPFPDGSYVITVESGGVVLLNETITVECVGVTAAVSCDATPAGVITFTYVNGSNAPVTYTSEATGGPTNVPADSVTVAAGATVDIDRDMLDDGTYVATVEIGGVVVYTETFTVDCVVDGVSTAVINPVACGGGGNVDVDLEVVGGTVPTDFDITIDGVSFGIFPVGPDAVSTEFVGPLLQGTFVIEVEVDGVVIASETVVVQCLAATSTATCIAGEAGQITLDYANDSAAGPVDFESVLTGPNPATGPLVSVAMGANAPAAHVFGPLDDGVYTVTTTTSTGEVITETITIECDIVVTLEDGCFADNGIIRAVVTNPTANPVVVVLNGVSPGPKTGTIAAGATGTVARTGRPDGTYNVTVTVDGTTVITRTILVQCDAPVEPPTPGDTTFTLNTFCAPDGRIRVTFINTGAGASTYSFDVLEIQNHMATTGTVAPGAQAIITRSGRPEGDYTVVVIIDGVTFTETVTVDCSDPGADASATAENLCVGGNGWFKFTLNADGSAATDFVVQVEGLPDRAVNGVAAGTTVMTSRTGRPDGDYDVAVLADGVVVYTDTFTVACD